MVPCQSVMLPLLGFWHRTCTLFTALHEVYKICFFVSYMSFLEAGYDNFLFCFGVGIDVQYLIFYNICIRVMQNLQ